jgi:hypothetical protein
MAIISIVRVPGTELGYDENGTMPALVISESMNLKFSRLEFRLDGMQRIPSTLYKYGFWLDKPTSYLSDVAKDYMPKHIMRRDIGNLVIFYPEPGFDSDLTPLYLGLSKQTKV